MGRFVLFVVLFAAVVYVIMWTIERRRAQGAPSRPRRGQPPRQVAPDDDDDFLRGIDPREGKGHDEPGPD